jgi:uncharacterized membrane protein YcaP (DUF421 family)
MNLYLDIILEPQPFIFLWLSLCEFLVKELSQLNTSDIILILLISNSVQNAMVGSNNSLTGGLVAASQYFWLIIFWKKDVQI